MTNKAANNTNSLSIAMDKLNFSVSHLFFLLELGLLALADLGTLLPIEAASKQSIHVQQ